RIEDRRSRIEDRGSKIEDRGSRILSRADQFSILYSLSSILYLSSILGANAAPPVTAVVFTPDGRAVVVGSRAGLEGRTWPELEKVRTLATELAHVHDLAFAPDGKSLAAAGGAPAQSGVVELFRWPDGGLLHRMKLHRDLVYAVAWRSDSAVFAT